MSILSFECVQKYKNSGIFMVYFMYLTLLHSFNLTVEERNIFG